MPEVKRPVFMSGENPGMTLFAPGSEQALIVASYWYCTDSPWGIGHALILWSQTNSRGIFTDNLKLAQTLVDKLTRYFPEFQEVPITNLPYIEAQCSHTFDGNIYQAICQSAETQITLEWSDILDRKRVSWPGFPAGESTFDLTTVICPCRIGRARVNNDEITGGIRTIQNADGHTSSTAFLAFAENWIGPFPMTQK